MAFEIDLNDPEVLAVNKIRRQKVAQAMQLLQEAGYNIELKPSNFNLTVICDEITVISKEDNDAKLVIDGIDISDYIWMLNITLTPNNFPSINVSFKTKPFLL